jgi:hypothetical protein
MKKFKIFLFNLVLLTSGLTLAQVTVYNKGTSITVSRGRIFINGNYINESSGNIANGGEIHISKDIINNSDNGLFTTRAGTLVLNGNGLQNISGNAIIDLFKLDVNKPSGNIVLQKNLIIHDSLRLLRGSIDLNSFNIDLLGTGRLAFENNKNRIYGASGVVKALKLFQHPALSENIAGLGLYISSGNNFDTTYFERGHSVQTFAGDSGILRYYNFSPSSAGHIDTLKFSYLDNSETIPDEFLYKVFMSDNGTDWKNKGGLVDTIHNFVISTTVSPPDINKVRFSIFPTENFATCLPNDPNYISAVFLASTTASNGDSLKFVQLSTSDPQSFAWNFGDSCTSIEESPYHVYHLPIDTIASSFPVTMTVSNGICSDTRKKTIEIVPATNSLRNMASFNGISLASIFPNPNSGVFTVDISTFDQTDISINLMDSEGNTVNKMMARGIYFNRQINIEQLSPGLYFLKIMAGNDHRILKLVKL